MLRKGFFFGSGTFWVWEGGGGGARVDPTMFLTVFSHYTALKNNGIRRYLKQTAVRLRQKSFEERNLARAPISPVAPAVRWASFW